MSGKLILGTVGAAIGAVAGALVWAAITAATHFQIGYMAVGVGFLAGAGMRILGGGGERADGIVAGAVALLGCALGNLLTAVIGYGEHMHLDAGATALAALAVIAKPPVAWALLREGFNLMDVLFYAIAVYTGYRTAMKPPTAAAPEPAA